MRIFKMIKRFYLKRNSSSKIMQKCDISCHTLVPDLKLAGRLLELNFLWLLTSKDMLS